MALCTLCWSLINSDSSTTFSPSCMKGNSSVSGLCGRCGRCAVGVVIVSVVQRSFFKFVTDVLGGEVLRLNTSFFNSKSRGGLEQHSQQIPIPPQLLSRHGLWDLFLVGSLKFSTVGSQIQSLWEFFLSPIFNNNSEIFMRNWPVIYQLKPHPVISANRYPIITSWDRSE